MTAQSDVRAAPTPRQRRDRIHLSGMEPERQWSANQDGRHDVAVLPVDPRRVPLDLEIVVPVYNEAPHIVERVTELRRFLDESFPFRTVVTVVDNASTDDTNALAT